MPGRDDLDIPMPSMAPSYRVPPRKREDLDPATRRLAAFAGVIGGALLLLVGVWSFTGHRNTTVPTIEADSRPIRVKPSDPGGMQVQGANDAILSGDGEAKQTVAPPPETPAPQALQAQEPAAAPATAAAPVAPTPPVSAAPAPTQVTVRPEQTPLPALRPHISVPAKPTSVAAPTPLAPAAAPSRPTLAAATPAPAPAPAAPVATKSALAMAAVAPARAPGATVGGTQVQLASVHSQDAAMAEWQRLQRKFPGLLGARQPVVSQTEIGGKPWFRLRTAGFTDVSQATQFCAQMKSAGGGCTVASF